MRIIVLTLSLANIGIYKFPPCQFVPIADYFYFQHRHLSTGDRVKSCNLESHSNKIRDRIHNRGRYFLKLDSTANQTILKINRPLADLV